jgi:hypothetical protein
VTIINRHAPWRVLGAALTCVAAILAGCGGGGGIGVTVTPVPQQTPTPNTVTGETCTNIENARPGVRIQAQYMQVGNPQFSGTTLSLNSGATTFNGHAANEFEVVTSGSFFPGLNVLAKKYASYDPGTGAATVYGALIALAGASFSSTVTAVNTPASVDLRFTLTADQSVTQSVTAQQTQVDTTNGVAAAPVTTTTTTTTTIQFVGVEQITVPAGTFNACKYVESIQGETGSKTVWNHTRTGVNLKTISTSNVTIQAGSVLLDGVALQ